MLRRAFTVSLILALPVLAACGDSGPSKQDFIAEADPVCKRGNDIALAFTTPSDLPMIKDFTTKIADNAAKTSDEVGKLDTPGGDDGTAAKDMVKAMRDAAAAARRVAPEVDKGNFPGVETEVKATVDAFRAADTKARAFGSAECGKGEAEAMGKLSQTSGETVKKAYIAKADALCKVANDKLESLEEPEDLATFKTFIDALTTTAEKLVADLKAIPQPSTDKAKLDEALSANDELIAKSKAAQAAAASGDEDKAIDAFGEVELAVTKANAKADAYGFKDCGSDA